MRHVLILTRDKKHEYDLMDTAKTFLEGDICVCNISEEYELYYSDSVSFLTLENMWIKELAPCASVRGDIILAKKRSYYIPSNLHSNLKSIFDQATLSFQQEENFNPYQSFVCFLSKKQDLVIYQTHLPLSVDFMVKRSLQIHRLLANSTETLFIFLSLEQRKRYIISKIVMNQYHDVTPEQIASFLPQFQDPTLNIRVFSPMRGDSIGTQELDDLQAISTLSRQNILDLYKWGCEITDFVSRWNQGART